ncbi:nitroreductase family protein [Mycolicibacterium hippocampi]|uniref:nitroreductase family protein n=1 Tax=Mycobacteriaceae TaxID=1762 RepID=UPI0015B4EB81
MAQRIEGNILVGRDDVAVDDVIALAESAQRALQRWNSDGVISDEIAPVAKHHEHKIDDVDGFFRSRRSVRDFDSAQVPDETLTRAVALALQSPSVCNRQAWRVRFFRGDDVSRILAHQNGNSGFRYVIPVVGLITVDTRMFSAAGERNQPWIEGGIFSMSLVWALHALRVDSCMLNMSVRNKQASAVRKEFGIPDNELIIMMIAIGYARPGHRIARSPRRQTNEVIVSRD